VLHRLYRETESRNRILDGEDENGEVGDA